MVATGSVAECVDVSCMAPLSNQRTTARPEFASTELSNAPRPCFFSSFSRVF